MESSWVPDTLSGSRKNPRENALFIDGKIKESQLATEVKNCMVAGQYSKEFSATETITINDVTQADFILVYYISPKLNKMLERGTDYSISALEKNIRIDLRPAYQMSGSTIYVQVLKIGGR